MLKKQDILSRTEGGLQVFQYYLQGNWRVGKNFKNPFYDDKNASCNIYKDKQGIYKMKDFGNDTFRGDCFFLVGYLYQLDCRNASDFIEILKIINRDLHLGLEESTSIITQKPQIPPTITIESITSETKKSISYQFTQKPFTQEELAYWQKYGITQDILNRYNVISLQSYSSTNKDGKPYTIASTYNEWMFAYLFKKHLKVYRPFSKLRFLYGGNPENYCFGESQLPLQGDILFITAGEKDVMSLASRGFSAICFNSETALIPSQKLQKLKMRFRHLVLLFDSDETGKRASLEQQAQLAPLEVFRLVLPLSGTKRDKDISDYFAQGKTGRDLLQLFYQTLSKHYEESLSLLKNCEIQWDKPPQKQETIISIGKTPVGVQSSLLGITGGEGTGKSHYVSALIAGCLNSKNLPIDTLGTTLLPCPKDKVVLFFDTEQSQDQLYQNISKLLKRAKLTSLPDLLHAFCLTQLPRRERLKVIREGLESFYYQCAGVHLVVIDGIADLIGAVNNEQESVELIEELYLLAGNYKTCIVCVLHLTPSGLKLRGHLGSELQRKATAVLSIEREKNSPISAVKPMKIRNGSLSDTPQILFRWNNELGMHSYVGNQKNEDQKPNKASTLASLVSPLFKERTLWTVQELNIEIQKRTDVKERTAKGYIRTLKEMGILVPQEGNGQLLGMGSVLKELLEDNKNSQG